MVPMIMTADMPLETIPKDTSADARAALEQLLDEIQTLAREHNQDWSEYYRSGVDYVWNNQLVNQDIKDGWEPLQLNRIFPAITQEQAMIAQRRVTIITQPVEDGDRPGADFWGPVHQWHFDQGINIPQLAMKAVQDGKTHGHWVARVWWDDKAEWNDRGRRWQGAIKAQLYKPTRVVIDPQSGDTSDRPEWTFALSDYTVAECLVRWPDYEDEIMRAGDGRAAMDSDAQLLAGFDVSSQDTMLKYGDDARDEGESFDTGQLVGLLYPSPTSTEVASDKLRRLWVEEFFIRDHTTKSAKITDHVYTKEELLADGRATEGPDPEAGESGVPVMLDSATGEPLHETNWPKEERDVDVPVYPFGRYVVRIGDTVVEDRAWTERHWPFVFGRNLMLPHTWHGLNGVEMARQIQDWLNVMARHFANYVNFFGDPTLAVEEGAFFNDPSFTRTPEKARSRAGTIWKLNQGGLQKIKRMDPAALSGGVFEIFNLFGKELDDQTGVHEIAKGRQASKTMTATEAADLAVASQQRPALQAILLDDWMVRVMRVVQDIAQRNMKEGDLVRVAGVKAAEALARRIPTEAMDANYDLKLDVVSRLPYDIERKKMEAEKLFAVLGIPYLPQLLEAFAVENAEELLQQVQAWQMLNAMQQVQAAQANADSQGPPAGGSPPIPVQAG